MPGPDTYLSEIGTMEMTLLWCRLKNRAVEHSEVARQAEVPGHDSAITRSEVEILLDRLWVEIQSWVEQVIETQSLRERYREVGV
eukprot:1370591-Amorphochlora_amoeboformis.AAC.1